jgi:hypothetical protein
LHDYLESAGVHDERVEQLFARLYDDELHGVDA